MHHWAECVWKGGLHIARTSAVNISLQLQGSVHKGRCRMQWAGFRICPLACPQFHLPCCFPRKIYFLALNESERTSIRENPIDIWLSNKDQVFPGESVRAVGSLDEPTLQKHIWHPGLSFPPLLPPPIHCPVPQLFSARRPPDALVSKFHQPELAWLGLMGLLVQNSWRAPGWGRLPMLAGKALHSPETSPPPPSAINSQDCHLHHMKKNQLLNYVFLMTHSTKHDERLKL